MMKSNSINPFPSSKYLGPKYFCDRKDEINSLLTNLKGQQSTTLVSIRRMGKTGLINHLQHKISKNWISVYVDILATENMEGFVNTISSAILNSVPKKTIIGQKIWAFFQSLHISISYDPLSGAPSVDFNLKENESRIQIKNIFNLLNEQQKPVLIAIDEFQQITQYPEKNMDAYLRTIIQDLQNVVFIFSGSQQHLMQELFSNPSKPFYRSTSFLHLTEIDFDTYRDFIIKKFKEHQKIIQKDTVEEILNWTRQHTYYVQLICNRLFTNSEDKIEPNSWKLEAQKLLKEQDLIFFTYRDLLTKAQWKLLKAIAKEMQVKNITASKFIKTYDLGSSATVIRSVTSLLKKDLIYKKFDAEGNSFYLIYDTLFQRWLERL